MRANCKCDVIGLTELPNGAVKWGTCDVLLMVDWCMKWCTCDVILVGHDSMLTFIYTVRLRLKKPIIIPAVRTSYFNMWSDLETQRINYKLVGTYYYALLEK
uniref:Uncharacterized protein n=1 Tax=Cacopsylla melanoneura TaxID=428564 RepID=A0A8D8MAZ9_9HEMI